MKGSRALFAVALSLSVHAGLALALRFRPDSTRAEPDARRLEVRLLELPPEPPKPPPPPPPEPAPRPEPPQPKPAPPKPAEPPAAPSAEVEPPKANDPAPAPEVAAPLALLDASIQAAVTGVAASTALDAPGGISRGGVPEPIRPALPTAPPAPAFTPLADLSRKPRAPSLDALLRRNYPEPLRRRGIDGQALVRAHITPRGRVAGVEVLSESAPGFADACRRTLVGSEWSEPLDRNGNRVATQLTYRCRFEIER